MKVKRSSRQHYHRSMWNLQGTTLMLLRSSDTKRRKEKEGL